MWCSRSLAWKRRGWEQASISDFVEFLEAAVPLVLDDHLFMLELVLRATMHKVEDGVQVSSHFGICRLQRLDTLPINDILVLRLSRFWHIQALRLELKVELLEVLLEHLVLLWHLVVAVRRVVVVHAQVNELVLHLVDDVPARGLVLLLEVFDVSH